MFPNAPIMNNTNYEYTLYSVCAFGINLATVTLVEISLLAASELSRFWFWRDLLIEEFNLFTA